MDHRDDAPPVCMRDAALLFDGSLTGGVYRVLGPEAELLASLRENGWHAAVVRQGDTKADFLRSVGVALGFPEYYGRNLDALWDCLSELSGPTALLWTSWHELAIEHPADWADILPLLQERAKGEPAFALVLA